MKKKILIIALIIMSALAIANEIDDFRFSVGLFSDRQFNLAERELRNFINNYPESSFLQQAKYLLAGVCLHNENYMEAGQIFKELLTEYDNPAVRPEILLGLIQAEFHNKNYLSSENYFKEYLQKFPEYQSRNSWNAFFIAGRIEYRKNNFQKAYEHFRVAENVIGFDYHQRQYWLLKEYKYRSMLELSKTKEIEAELMSYIGLSVRNEFIYETLYNYYLWLFNNGFYEKLTLFALDFISVNSRFYDDYLLLLVQSFYELNDYEAAEERLKLVQKDNDLVSFYQGLIKFRKNELRGAEDIFYRLMENADNLKIRTSSTFHYAIIISNRDIDTANSILKELSEAEKNNDFKDQANYQIGVNYFKAGDYDEALTFLFKSINKPRDTKFANLSDLTTNLESFVLENAILQVVECYFLNLERELYLHFIELYLNSYPNGRFKDEVLFKKAYDYYSHNRLTDAQIVFNSIINEFPRSRKKGLANLYLGDIYIRQNRYGQAKEKLEAALAEENVETASVWLRIAEIYLNTREFDKATSALINVPDTNQYLYEKNIIQGNIHFGRRNYQSALNSFQAAERFAVSQVRKTEAMVKQARTHYQLKNYSRATQIYNSLSQLDGGRQFSMLAARSAFNAEDYHEAIKLFREFLQNFPDGNDSDLARLHIGDSYYNLADYQRAVEYYIPLIRSDVEESVRVNAFNGLEWSALQTEEINFIEELDKILETETDMEFKIFIYQRKAIFYFNRQEWINASNTASFLIQLYENRYGSDEKPREYYDKQRILAVSYTNLEQYNNADRIFQYLYRSFPQANIIYDWAFLKIAEQDTLGAIDKLKEAAELSQSSSIWLDLLNLLKKTEQAEFNDYYNNFTRFATGSDKERAQLLWVEWNIINEKYTAVNSVLETLLRSNFDIVKANAQYLKGFKLFKEGSYQEAIPDLLRIRYLYPTMEELRIEAELLVCYAYINLDDKENALKIFDSIKNSLDTDTRKQLESLLY